MHLPRTPLALCLAASILAAATAPAAAASSRRLEQVLPADTTMMLLVEDLPGLRAAWPGLPWVRAWNEPDIQAFFAPLRDAAGDGDWLGLLEGTGGRAEELMALVTGQVAVVLPDARTLLDAAGEGSGHPTVAVLAHVGDRGAELTALLSRPDSSAGGDGGEGAAPEDEAAAPALVEATFRDVTLHLRRESSAEGPVERQGWAVVGDVAVMAEPRSLLESMVGALLDGNGGLDRQPAFGRVAARVGRPSGLLYLNMEPLVTVLMEKARESQAAGEPNPLGISPEAVLRALGLDALDAAYVSMELGADVTRADAGLLAHEDRGIIKLLAFQPPASSLPGFLPADAVRAGASYFSLPRMWAALKEMIAQVNPMLLGMLDSQLAQLSAQLGVDLEKSIVEGLGDATYSAAFLPRRADGQPASLLEMQEISIVELRDRAGLEKSVDALLRLFSEGDAPSYTVSEASGVEVRTLSWGIPAGLDGEEKHLAYAFTDKHLYLAQGGEEPIRRILAAQAAAGPGVWSRPQVKAALGQVPAGASLLQYEDSGLLLAGFLSTLATLQGQQGALGGGEERFVDPEALPDPEVVRRYFRSAVSALHKSADGVFMTWRLFHTSP